MGDRSSADQAAPPIKGNNSSQGGAIDYKKVNWLFFLAEAAHDINRHLV